MSSLSVVVDSLEKFLLSKFSFSFLDSKETVENLLLLSELKEKSHKAAQLYYLLQRHTPFYHDNIPQGIFCKITRDIYLEFLRHPYPFALPNITGFYSCWFNSLLQFISSMPEIVGAYISYHWNEGTPFLYDEYEVKSVYNMIFRWTGKAALKFELHNLEEEEKTFNPKFKLSNIFLWIFNTIMSLAFRYIHSQIHLDRVGKVDIRSEEPSITMGIWKKESPVGAKDDISGRLIAMQSCLTTAPIFGRKPESDLFDFRQYDPAEFFGVHLERLCEYANNTKGSRDPVSGVFVHKGLYNSFLKNFAMTVRIEKEPPFIQMAITIGNRNDESVIDMDEILTQIHQKDKPVSSNILESMDKEMYFESLPRSYLFFKVFRRLVGFKLVNVLPCSTKFEWRLRSFVCHFPSSRDANFGVTNFEEYGHYVAYVYRGRRWYCCDDTCITEVDINEILSMPHIQTYISCIVYRKTIAPKNNI